MRLDFISLELMIEVKKKMNIYNLRYLISAFICSPFCAPIRNACKCVADVPLVFHLFFASNWGWIRVVAYLKQKHFRPSHASHRYNLYTFIFPIHSLPSIANILLHCFPRWLDSRKLGWPRRRKIVQTYVKIVALKRSINNVTVKCLIK